MAFAITPPANPVAGNLLLSYVNGLTSNLGVALQPGQESAFLSSLQGNGLAADDVQILARVLSGKSVKLHEYRGVVQDLERLIGSHLAEGALRERVERSEDVRDQVHDQAMLELNDRGLEEDFLNYVLMSVMVSLDRGTLPTTDAQDVSPEFRHYVEDQELPDLIPLADKYIRAAQRVYQDRALLRAIHR